MRKFLLSIALLFAPIAFAADNTSFTITGTGFGTNTPTSQVFLGGSAGAIESQSNGTGAGTVGTPGIFGSGWNVAGAATQNSETVSTGKAWSSTKSLKEDNQGGVQYQFGAVYDTGAQYTTVYGRFIVQVETSINRSLYVVQTKLVRHLGQVSCQDGLGDQDTPDTYLSSFVDNYSSYAINYTSGSCTADNTLTPTVFVGDPGNYSFPFNKWMLVEYTIKFSSAVGVADAVYHIKVTDIAANTVFVDYTKSSVLNWVAADLTRPYRYITMHGAIVNLDNNPGYSPGPAWQVNLWWDSNWYMATTSSGTTTPKFVLRCNASTWASVTANNCAIQKWSSWANTSISITRNYANVPAAGGAWYYAMSDIDTPINTTGIADSENSGASTSVNPAAAAVNFTGATSTITATGNRTIAPAAATIHFGQNTSIITVSNSNKLPVNFQQMRRRRRYGDVPVTNDYYYNKVVSNEH